MDTYIEILNDHNNAEEMAKAIAKHYSTSYEKMDDGSCQVKCNKELEHAFCNDEDDFEAACNEVAQCQNVVIYSDDICF